MTRINTLLEDLTTKLARRDSGDSLVATWLHDDGVRVRGHFHCPNALWLLVAKSARAKGTTKGQIVREALQLYFGAVLTTTPPKPRDKRTHNKRSAKRVPVKARKPRAPRKPFTKRKGY